MVRLSLSLLLAAGLAAPVQAQGLNPDHRGPTMLIHGNYCGPGNNAPLPPVDALDVACAHHDACSPDGGLPSRACNARLAREADLISRDPRQPEDIRMLAGMIALGAGMLPSASPMAPAALGTTGPSLAVPPRRVVLPPGPADLDGEGDE
ncbi:hypothetical protein [Methylobacterium nodulans]|uniref:Phospholipase A2 n=1 Tax=Methylobacterium nodulans (strain LMG 21967 / CNCM I-2342 / ORS 2060) TaxID=460265 RepID=B8ILB1_METNO|nr:hypothetical protein [Methylobacterium nodulans]ACL60110.1 conserved hypothetical protein [Methylobacterium nodulans ORS 2060]